MILKSGYKPKADHYLKRVTLDDVNDANKFKLPITDSELLKKIEQTQTVSVYPNRLDKKWFNAYLKKYMACRQPSGYLVLRTKEDEFKFHCIPSTDEVMASHRRVRISSTFDPRSNQESYYVMSMNG